MAMTIRSCERFPIDLFGPQARLDVANLVAQAPVLERGIDINRMRLLQSKRDRGTLFVTPRLERADQSRNSLSVCMRGDATPHFTAHRSAGRPSLLCKIDKHARQSWVAAPVQFLDRPQM